MNIPNMSASLRQPVTISAHFNSLPSRAAGSLVPFSTQRKDKQLSSSQWIKLPSNLMQCHLLEGYFGWFRYDACAARPLLWNSSQGWQENWHYCVLGRINRGKKTVPTLSCHMSSASSGLASCQSLNYLTRQVFQIFQLCPFHRQLLLCWGLPV